MCLAQGHKAVKPVRLKLTTSQSRVKHSATEPLRSAWGFKGGFWVYAISTKLSCLISLKIQNKKKWREKNRKCHYHISQTNLLHQEEEAVVHRPTKTHTYTHDYNWAVLRQNLSSGFLTKLDSNQFPGLQRLARKVENFTFSKFINEIFQKANNICADQTAHLRRLV